MAIVVFIVGGIVGLILGYNVSGDDRDIMARENARLHMELDMCRKAAEQLEREGSKE